MARLPKGEKQKRKKVVASLVRLSGLGLKEEEISQETGWERRTVNSYLHELDEEGQVHRDKGKWFPF